MKLWRIVNNSIVVGERDKEIMVNLPWKRSG